jgi:hypothetical protein
MFGGVTFPTLSFEQANPFLTGIGAGQNIYKSLQEAQKQAMENELKKKFGIPMSQAELEYKQAQTKRENTLADLPFGGQFTSGITGQIAGLEAIKNAFGEESPQYQQAKHMMDLAAQTQQISNAYKQKLTETAGVRSLTQQGKRDLEEFNIKNGRAPNGAEWQSLIDKPGNSEVSSASSSNPSVLTGASGFLGAGTQQNGLRPPNLGPKTATKVQKNVQQLGLDLPQGLQASGPLQLLSTQGQQPQVGLKDAQASEPQAAIPSIPNPQQNPTAPVQLPPNAPTEQRQEIMNQTYGPVASQALTQAPDGVLPAPSAADKYELKDLKDNVPQNLLTRLTAAANVDTTLENIDINAITKYAGIKGKALLAQEKYNTVFNPSVVSEDYYKYQESQKNLTLLAKQLRQFYQDSVQPKVGKQYADMLQDQDLFTNPKVAKRSFLGMVKTIKQEELNLRIAANKSDIYRGQRPSYEQINAQHDAELKAIDQKWGEGANNLNWGKYSEKDIEATLKANPQFGGDKNKLNQFLISKGILK